MKKRWVLLNPYVDVEWGIQNFSSMAEVRSILIPSEEELIMQIRDVHLVVADVDLRITRRVLEAAPHLKAVVCTATGVDYVDLPEATRRGVLITNLPDYSVEAVAEHALALMFSLCRNIIPGMKAILEGRWDRARFMQGMEVEGKTLGVVGLGRIGRRVAEKGRALGMSIAFYDPYIFSETVRERGYERKDTLLDLLKCSDIVTVHAFLATGSKRMFGEPEFRAMKPSSLFLNVARGGIVDEKALYTALKERWIAGAGVDVMADEPPSKSDPLLGLDNFVVTPHIAWNTKEAEDRLKNQLHQIITAILHHQFPINVVNPEVKERWMEDVKAL
jgi:D-3-phosphoglycerate dehydrogenase / 2-oxoglutarate reductase